MVGRNTRRTALKSMGVAVGAALAAGTAAAAPGAAASLLPEGAATLGNLKERLAKAPRRRDFKTVPMILNSRDQWDHEALSELIAYRGAPRQVWDNTDLGGPWLNLMRNSLNAQVWSFRHPDFLVVSATHGLAHLALFDQATWDKYQLAKMAGDKFKSNSLIVEPPAAAMDPKDYERSDGVFSPHDNSIVTLQRRGVVFLSCHNAIWETAEKLLAASMNPDKLSHEALAAELTNHLIPGVVLTPGAVGTLPELQQAGFHYAK
ncbi:thiosulfate dehydrogenase [Noviherbaspirillum pedocola]|uniref:Transcriptional initiation protein Tat n=1 Tax=Noviherbaspirillum pedocola TaxID=2801341 RepID=A0A934SQZ1_9BURK|nr:transcriptional initiation protein Tat [Noviherbaspirillum pedocola]MBK4734970.1 transcriptional initiation protein Tat [Noviherbaspirillum pedocola]